MRGREAASGWAAASGRAEGGTDDLTRRACAHLRDAGFHATAHAKVMTRKYGKLISNLANAPEALFGHGDATRTIAVRLRREGEAVLDAASIDYAPCRELTDACKARISPSRPAGGSSRPGLNGEIVRLAASAGITAPLNHRIQQLTLHALRDGAAAGSLDPAIFDLPQ